jgi:hypothetical protein
VVHAVAAVRDEVVALDAVRGDEESREGVVEADVVHDFDRVDESAVVVADLVELALVLGPERGLAAAPAAPDGKNEDAGCDDMGRDGKNEGVQTAAASSTTRPFVDWLHVPIGGRQPHIAQDNRSFLEVDQNGLTEGSNRHENERRAGL